jgi:signal transduction histidine kinase
MSTLPEIKSVAMETFSVQKQNLRGLQKSDRIINQFITSCSHSMRGPLKSIEGLANLLLQIENHSSDDIRLMLNLILNTTFGMENMLDQLEYFLENSKREVSYQTIECGKIVGQVLDEFDTEIQRSNIKLSVIDQELAEVNSDAARLRIVLSNVIKNAIEFRDDRKELKFIEIKIKSTLQHCSFLISDNGIGMEQENLSQIFQIFYRGSEKSSGAGIGLYVAQETIRKMGGAIKVSTAMNKGSVFTITIPRSQFEND